MALSATCTFHLTAPVFASSATRCESAVPMKTVSPSIATPRLVAYKPIDTTCSGSTGDQLQSLSPVRTSNAVTVLGGSVMYITPSTTMGDASRFDTALLGWYIHATFKLEMFSRLICLSDENCCDE